MGAVLAGGVFVADADHLIHMYIPFMRIFAVRQSMDGI